MWRRSSRQKGSVSADPSPPGPDRRFSGVFDDNLKSSTLPPTYRNRTNSGHPVRVDFVIVVLPIFVFT